MLEKGMKAIDFKLRDRENKEVIIEKVDVWWH